MRTNYINVATCIKLLMPRTLRRSFVHYVTKIQTTMPKKKDICNPKPARRRQKK